MRNHSNMHMDGCNGCCVRSLMANNDNYVCIVFLWTAILSCPRRPETQGPEWHTGIVPSAGLLTAFFTQLPELCGSVCLCTYVCACACACSLCAALCQWSIVEVTDLIVTVVYHWGYRNCNAKVDGEILSGTADTQFIYHSVYRQLSSQHFFFNRLPYLWNALPPLNL